MNQATAEGAPYPICTYPTVHFWTAQEHEGNYVVTIMRRHDLHACFPVLNLLTLPAVSVDKVINLSDIADAICANLDRQLVENGDQSAG